MNPTKLRNEDNVVRYARPSDIGKDGNILWTAFRLRPTDTGLSVNWLEYFRKHTKKEQLKRVRLGIRTALEVKQNARLAELNVGTTMENVGSQSEENLCAIQFIHTPAPDNPSHAEITGLPAANSPDSQAVAMLIAESVTDKHPAVLNEES